MKSTTVNKNKRSAAGMADSTKGRSRTFRDRTKYTRKIKHKIKGDDGDGR